MQSEKKSFFKSLSEKRYLVLFFLAAFFIGFALALFFYFTANASKLFLDITALLLFLLILARSFYKKWEKNKERPFKKFIRSIPAFLHVVNTVAFFLFFIPKLIRLFSKERVESDFVRILWLLLIFFSFLILVCMFLKLFCKKERTLDNA